MRDQTSERSAMALNPQLGILNWAHRHRASVMLGAFFVAIVALIKLQRSSRGKDAVEEEEDVPLFI